MEVRALISGEDDLLGAWSWLCRLLRRFLRACFGASTDATASAAWGEAGSHTR